MKEEGGEDRRGYTGCGCWGPGTRVGPAAPEPGWPITPTSGKGADGPRVSAANHARSFCLLSFPLALGGGWEPAAVRSRRGQALVLDPPEPRAVLSQQTRCWDGEARLHAPTCQGQTHQSSEGGLGGTQEPRQEQPEATGVRAHRARALWPMGSQASSPLLGAGRESFLSPQAHPEPPVLPRRPWMDPELPAGR